MYFQIDTSEDPRLKVILENASRLQGRALGRLAQAIYKAGQEVAGAAVKDRFTGQGPFPPSQNRLGVRTGRLHRSIRCTKPQVNLRTGEISMQFGSNVVYFAIHEFGFKGAVQVKGHTRRLAGGQKFIRGKLTKRHQERMKKNRRTGGKGFAEVRPHKRKVDVKARAPLGTQLKHVSTRAAFLRALRNALEPLLREK